jgi:RNA polymerase sigma factor (sigma-70 family)
METRRSRLSLSLVLGQNHQAASDGDVARGLVLGQDWAIEQTWRRFSPMVLTTALRVLGSKSEAEDIVQDVFCLVWRSANTLREPDKLRSFVYSVAMRALINELRRKRQHAWLHRNRLEPMRDLGCEMESRDLLRKFHALLMKLRPRESLVFVLRQLNEMTVEEIAVIMGISESTVKRSLSRASLRLARWINADPELVGLFKEGGWAG